MKANGAAVCQRQLRDVVANADVELIPQWNGTGSAQPGIPLHRLHAVTDANGNFDIASGPS